MAFKTVNYGKSERRNYASIKSNLALPNLTEIQENSFNQFLEEGIRDSFKDISPICDNSGKIKIHFGEYHFNEPKYSVRECKLRNVNYSQPLKVMVKLENDNTGEIVENELFFGDFPMMTPECTFIVNGAERVIVSQIVRSSGVFYASEIDSKSNATKFTGQVIPTRGAWIEYEIDSKDIWYAKLDRSKKIFVSTLLRAFGLSSDSQIIDLFGKTPWLQNTLAKDTTTDSETAVVEVYAKLRQGEKVPVEGARELLRNRLFDERRYELASVGRFKFNNRLDVLLRAKGLILGQDVVDPETGEVIASKDTVITQDIVELLAANRHCFREKVELEGDLVDEDVFVEKLVVLVKEGKKLNQVNIVGCNVDETKTYITISDILASASAYFNFYSGVGRTDDIDHLGNRRLKLIGELVKNSFRVGLGKLEKNIKDKMSTVVPEETTPQSLINIKPLTSALKEFFGSSQLSQFMDQTNPLSELTHKRRISALGAGGLSRDRAGVEVRDVHFSHYGRMCPIETPEGPNIGLITSLATYASVDEYGFIKTPYFRVDKTTGLVDVKSIEYLTADIELKHTIASAVTKISESGEILDERIVARNNGEASIYSKEEIDFVEVSPQQIVSVATSCIPFLEHDDANRALMGANMQRQAIPLINPDSPIVGTGMEHRAAADSGSCITVKSDGVVKYVDAKKITIEHADGEKTYELAQFMRQNQETSFLQRPIVSVGESVSKGDVIADGPSVDKGELALGQNVVVAFMTWDGYNYEDAIVMSERLVKEDVYTSLKIVEYSVDACDTKLGKEEITRDIQGVSSEAVKMLDEDGIIITGSEVREGDILVGKVTPKGHSEPTPEEKLLLAIFGEKSREVRDTSLKVPHGGGGIVQSVHRYKKSDGHELKAGVNEVIRINIVKKRKISEGDKMAGRHGNKGVISRILPVEDMPYMEDGTPVDIMLNPLGVPSRMNIGQILEIHLGMAAKKLGIKVATPVFDGASQDDLEKILEEAGMEPTGKTPLYDGKTGRKYDNDISVGVMYMIKLAHMVDDKLHARAVGPYTLVTQQPMGGKAQNGGQRFGEMEVWALEAYGAAHTLQEMLTVKSDDIMGRNKVFRAIVDGDQIPDSSIPESFRVLTRELQALGIHVELINEETGENEVNKSLVDNEDNYISKFGFNK